MRHRRLQAGLFHVQSGGLHLPTDQWSASYVLEIKQQGRLRIHRVDEDTGAQYFANNCSWPMTLSRTILQHGDTPTLNSYECANCHVYYTVMPASRSATSATLKRDEAAVDPHMPAAAAVFQRSADRRSRPRSCGENTWRFRMLVRTPNRDSSSKSNKMGNLRGTTTSSRPCANTGCKLKNLSSRPRSMRNSVSFDCHPSRDHQDGRECRIPYRVLLFLGLGGCWRP